MCWIYAGGRRDRLLEGAPISRNLSWFKAGILLIDSSNSVCYGVPEELILQTGRGSYIVGCICFWVTNQNLLGILAAGEASSMKFIGYLKQTESKTFELKRDLSSKKGILKTISSFSNTSGGTLLIGIEDDRTVVGLANPMDDEEKLASIISDGISPQVLPEIDILSWRDRNVLRVVVYLGPSRPYFLTSTGKEAGHL